MTIANRRPIIAGNWKMNTKPADARTLAAAVRDQLPAVPEIDVILCPPFVSLALVAGEVDGSPISVGAQNMHPEPSGAYTGEISPEMLASICHYVILGHSERRAFFSEANGFVNRKVLAALTNGLRPIICVGETLDQRDAGRTAPVLRRQTRASLADVSDFTTLAIAYEPVWAIGTGRAATPQDATDGITAIRETVASMVGASVAEAVPILYGGSVNSGNANALFEQPQVDGALVGGAALQADEFVQIAVAAQESLS